MRHLINTEGLAPDLALCAELLVYAAVRSDAAADRTPAEIQDAMLIFFTREQVRQALVYIKDHR